jgi:hypothetical protein
LGAEFEGEVGVDSGVSQNLATVRNTGVISGES